MYILKNKKYQIWEESSPKGMWITIFTPSYNRAHFLPRLYDGLIAQTNKCFVWILVCDGSIDNSKEVAESLLNKNDFPMCFIYKENGGKHSAFKSALEITNTPFFVCMDDDDLYSPCSVDTFLKVWSEIQDDGLLEHIGAIRTLTKREDGTYASNVEVSDDEIGRYTDCTSLERNYVYRIVQENWTCYRTNALRSIEIFPKGYWMEEYHHFFNESIWQGRFARKYKCRYLNVCLREYRQDAEVSLIRAKKTRQHYIDMFINTHIVMEEQSDYIIKVLKTYLQNIGIVGILGAKLDIPYKELWNHTSRVSLRALYFLSYIIGEVIPFRKIQ